MEIKHRDLHRITSTAIIVKEDKYLIVKRSPKKKGLSKYVDSAWGRIRG